VLSPQAADPEVNLWMSKAIVLFENGDRVRGEYDGYGRLTTGEGYGKWDFAEVTGLTGPCIYHLACWETAGRPKFSGPCKSSADQGWFFEAPDHDMLEPGTVPTEEQAARLEVSTAMRDGRKRGQAFLAKDEEADPATFYEAFRLIVLEAEAMTKDERWTRWGFDPLDFVPLDFVP